MTKRKYAGLATGNVTRQKVKTNVIREPVSKQNDKTVKGNNSLQGNRYMGDYRCRRPYTSKVKINLG